MAAVATRGVLCGSLACQKDSYIRSIKARVLSCEQIKQAAEQTKKKKKKAASNESTANMWAVTLTDTVLFPEGGGQPCDHGTLGDAEVSNVQNIDGHAVHTTSSPLDIGTEVDVAVDWRRRWDHMQQHSGQHLITAIAIKLFGYQTDAWNLGPDISFLDLVTPTLSVDERNQLEKAANDAIRNGHAVTPRWIDPKDPEVSTIRCRGLPDNVEGDIRVLEITDIDKNLCCGTHVKNTMHLQAVKLLKVEKAKKNTRVYFVAGDRVLEQLGSMFNRQLAVTASLAVAPERHVEQIDQMWKTMREADKRIKSMGREVALLISAGISEKFKRGERFAHVHQDLGDLESMKAIHAEVEPLGCVTLTTSGTGNGTAGMFMMSGPDNLIKQLGPIAATQMDGKGGGKGRFQGKVNSVNKWTGAVEAIESKMSELTVGEEK